LSTVDLPSLAKAHFKVLCRKQGLESSWVLLVHWIREAVGVMFLLAAILESTEAESVLAVIAPASIDLEILALHDIGGPHWVQMLQLYSQIGVGEAGGVKLLLAAIDKGDEAQSALAAKALASVIRGTQALQEVLLDAGGTNVLMRHLEAPETHRADENKGEAKSCCPYNTFALKRELLL